MPSTLWTEWRLWFLAFAGIVTGMIGTWTVLTDDLAWTRKSLGTALFALLAVGCFVAIYRLARQRRTSHGRN